MMKNVNQILLAFTLALLWTYPLYAQDQAAAEALEKINNIKLDGSYIWAEGTSAKNKKEALENAQAVLRFEIQNWLNEPEQKNVAGVAIPTSDQYLKIETERKKIHRAFVYVKKELIMPYMKNEKVVVVERKEEKPEKAKKKQELVSTVEQVYTPSDFERDMLAVKYSSEMEEFINRHHISQTGKYKTRPNTGSYYIFIYNREGMVPACLKISDGYVINVATGKPDGFENYKGCGGQWFIVSE